MTIQKLDHLEDRIQKPGYLLLLVVVLLFLIIGLVNLIDHKSRNPVLFGQYSLGYFAIIVGYTLLVLAWGALLLRPNTDTWLTKSLDFVQRRPPLAIAILIGIAAVFVIMMLPTYRPHALALEKPALQATVMVTLLLTAGLILFHKWGDPSRPQLWRKVVVGLLALILAVELVVQALAFFGLLPNVTETTDSFAPYSRVYQTGEGFGNGITNKYGLYAPEFALQPDSTRYALLGDGSIQGLQVDKEQNVGVVLQNLIDESAQAEPPIEIITVGYPDYGPGIYLSNWMLNLVRKVFAPEDVIVFLDFNNDFQTVDRPGTGRPYYTYAGQGRVKLNLEDFNKDLHDYEHEMAQGHEGFQLVRLIGSHYLTPRVLQDLLAEPSVQAAEAAPLIPNADIDLPNGFVFNAATNDEAMMVARGQLTVGQEQLARADIGVRLVTIPTFTAEFYAQDAWNTQFGGSDLLLPEQELRQYAAQSGMPFLGLGTFMAAQGMAPSEVQELYFNNGRGHLTPAGHAFVAGAVYHCFFAQTLTPAAGCDLR